MEILKAEKINKGFGDKQVLKDVSITLNEGEIISLLGVSGSGKTTLFNVLSGIYNSDSGSVYLKGKDITGKPGEISYMLQKDLLFPYRKVIDNVALPLIIKGMSKKEAREKASPLFKTFGLDGYQMKYPSQMSGGMRQRVMIAMALACEPDILIADEPTTALDVTIQAKILELIKELQDKKGISVIYITHDLGVVAKVADYVAVMYAGRIVEKGRIDEVFYDPRHPYTWGLLSSMPDTDTNSSRLYAIPGTPPNLMERVQGDAFAPRNAYALNIDYKEEPPMFDVGGQHRVASWLCDPHAPKVELPPELVEKLTKMKKEAGIDE